MGLYIIDLIVDVSYRIIEGDSLNIFKVEYKRVGDFVFLRIRI